MFRAHKLQNLTGTKQICGKNMTNALEITLIIGKMMIPIGCNIFALSVCLPKVGHQHSMTLF